MNRILNQVLAMEKQVVKIYGNVVITAAGAVSSYAGLGVTSVVKNGGTGDYTITLDDAQPKFLNANCTTLHATGASGIGGIELMAVGVAAKTYNLLCLDYTGVAANPASGTTIYFEIAARRSSVGPA